jgi:hypothetical protein
MMYTLFNIAISLFAAIAYVEAAHEYRHIELGDWDTL